MNKSNFKDQTLYASDTIPKGSTAGAIFMPVFRFLIVLLLGAALFFLFYNHRKALQETNRLAEIIQETEIHSDYAHAIAFLQTAITDNPKAKNHHLARDLIKRFEQGIVLAAELARTETNASINFEQAFQDLVQTLHTNPTAINRLQAEAKLKEMREIHIEKQFEAKMVTQESYSLAETMREVQTMTDLTGAVAALQEAMKTCATATNLHEASELLEKLQLSSAQTTELRKAMDEAQTHAQFDARKAIDDLGAKLRENPLAGNKAEVQALLQMLSNRSLEAEIARKKRETDSVALVQAVEQAKNAKDLKVAARMLEEALKQYPDATNSAQVVAIIARIAQGGGHAAGHAGGLGISAENLRAAARWQANAHKGNASAGDIHTLLNKLGKPLLDTAPSPISIYHDVTYLMPLSNAVDVLRLNPDPTPKTPVNTPGFPDNSFFYYTYSGRYEDNFTKLLLVVDIYNQVAAVQLVESYPKDTTVEWDWWGEDQREYRLYNIVENKTKTSGKDQADWKNMTFVMNPNLAFSQLEAPDTAITHIIESKLTTPSGSQTKIKERTRLYLPQPIVNLLLYVLSGGN